MRIADYRNQCASGSVWKKQGNFLHDVAHFEKCRDGFDKIGSQWLPQTTSET
jgi:hypothetical protein